MTTRVKHNMDLPKIAQAIQEYKTTHKTQRQCAAEFGITYKLFSYYYLNGFKKNQKVGGGLIPEETPYQKKAKQRANNYEVMIVGSDNKPKQQDIPQLPPAPVSHQLTTSYIKPLTEKPISSKSISSVKQYSEYKTETQRGGASIDNSISGKIKAASSVSKSGKKHVDLDPFIKQ